MDIAELTQRILDRRPRPDRPLEIVQAGHPALRRRAQSALAQSASNRAGAEEDPARADAPAPRSRLPLDLLAELVEAMTLTMRDAPGVGLAAPQIGLPLAVVVMEDPFAAEPGEDPDDELLERRPLELRALLDPAYEVLGDEDVYAWEGCLSVSGWQSIVPRSRRVRLTGVELGADGSLRRIDEEHIGWTARIIQHESDHLDGTLCHDRAVPRSFAENRWAARFGDVCEAVARLGLEGDVARLAPGQAVLPRR